MAITTQVSETVRYALFALLMALACPMMSRAETTMLIEPSSTGGFLVSAGNLNGIISAEIRFDFSSGGASVPPSVDVLANYTQATLQSSSGNYGTVLIRIKAPKPMRGHLYLARINNLVDQYGNPGSIFSPSAIFTRADGRQETARVDIINPVPVDVKPDTTDPSAQRKISIAEAKEKQRQERLALPVVETGGDITARGTSGTGSTERTRETIVLVASPSPASPAKPEKPASPPVFRRLESIADRFRRHTGDWSPEVIRRYFNPIAVPEFRQQPALLIADGAAEVLVAVRATNISDVLNCFVIKGGSVTSVQPGEAGEWLLRIVPPLGAMDVTVTVHSEQNIIEYPLTVAPPLEIFDAATAKAGVAEFVKAANESFR